MVSLFEDMRVLVQPVRITVVVVVVGVVVTREALAGGCAD